MKSERHSSSWICKHCNKEFKYESEKRRHEQSHEPQFDCKVCSKKFSFLSALHRHKKQHERKGSVPCSKCGRSFRDDVLLKRHMQYAHKGRHTCTECKSTYYSETALRTHLKTHKPESERKFRCSFSECDKTFNFAHHLKHHLLTHTNDKPHICKECGKGFIQLHHLKVHQRMHMPEMWLYCPEADCGKGFTNEYALKRHIFTIHTKSKKRITKKKSVNTVDDDDVRFINQEEEEFPLQKTCDQLKPSTTDFRTIVQCTYILRGRVLTIEPLHGSLVDVFEKQEDVIDGDLENPTFHKIKCYDDKEVLETETVQTVNVIGQNNTKFLNVEIETDENDSPVSNCKSVLGQCIVSGDKEGNNDCLCAQIDANQDVEKKSSILAEDNDIKIELRNDPKCIEKRRNNADACETCECASICGVKINTKDPDPDDTKPKLVYHNDGSIKIKDAFDLNLSSPIIKNEIDDFNVKSVPISSCRDVLGNCIVSGNGAIGEGCLCARMTAEDQQVSAQEIEEITPCPKSILRELLTR